MKKSYILQKVILLLLIFIVATGLLFLDKSVVPAKTSNFQANNSQQNTADQQKLLDEATELFNRVFELRKQGQYGEAACPCRSG